MARNPNLRHAAETETAAAVGERATCNPFDLPLLPLQEAPTNTQTKRLFVAATRMNDGKTTTCLGLYAALAQKYGRIGYIKPIGQRFVDVGGRQVDEDSFLLDTIFQVRVPIESMSPVTVDATFTRRFLKDPSTTLPKLEDMICRAFDRVSWEKDFTLIEGTGHAGVGSVFQLSNARVAQLLNAKVILVCPGGIGRPIDEIALNKALFDKLGVEVVGVILNKVETEKIPLIREYAGLGLERLGVPLLGVLPRQQVLASPNLRQIAEALDGEWLNSSRGLRHRRVDRFVMGAMGAAGAMDSLDPNTVLITPGDRDDIIHAVVTTASRKRVAGLILTNAINPNESLLEAVRACDIPILAVKDDSFDVAKRISRATVKTQPEDVDKIPLIKQMVLDHVDLTALTARL